MLGEVAWGGVLLGEVLGGEIGVVLGREIGVVLGGEIVFGERLCLERDY